MNKELISQNVLKSLEIMWKGLLAIFIVIAIVTISTLLLNYIAKKIRSKKEQVKNKTSIDGQNNASPPPLI